MKVELPYVVQDQLTAVEKGMKAVESFHYDNTDDEDEHFLDGPVSRRLAVLDFDEKTGALSPPVRFQPPSGRRKLGRYALPNGRALSSREFQKVSVFATVLKTMHAFETEDVLGRRLTWAFDGPQLLIVPRAGNQANAFYERESGSLQFFYFNSQTRPGKLIHTSLSHDIISHEAGHAILDGLAPDLYDAITPQALALHEAIADLTSIVLALESHTLRDTVLRQTGGSISGPSAISAVAEEFGGALNHGRLSLRSARNKKTLDPADHSLDENGEPNLVSRDEPHDLSQVLTGALYTILVSAHERLKRNATKHVIDPDEREQLAFSESGEALAVAAKIFRRFLFRALDYLPPGDVSFADYGRAIVAADFASNPRTDYYRKGLIKEFVARKIVRNEQSLLEGIPSSPDYLKDLDLDALVASDWAAYDFANDQSKLLGIPEDVPFRVRPRLMVEKETFRSEGVGPHQYREFIFKVSWEHDEANNLEGNFPSRRAVTMGTTLVIDYDTRQIRALLKTDKSRRQSRDRNLFLKQMYEQELLPDRDDEAARANLPHISVFENTSTANVMRVAGAARSLHMMTTGG